MALLLGAVGMLGGTIGGACGVVAARIKGGNRKDVAEIRNMERDLLQRIKTLESSAKEDSGDGTHASAEVAELEAQHSELKARADQLELEKEALEESNRSMTELHLLLCQSNEKLGEQAQQLMQEKQELMKELSALRLVRQQESEQHAAVLEELRNKVSEIVNKLLAHGIDEAEATELLQGLGCEVQYVDALPEAAPVVEASQVAGAVAAAASEAAAAPAVESARAAAESTSGQAALEPKALESEPRWDGQTRLLMDNKSRIERLVTSCIAPGLLSDSAAARIPVVTLPSLRGMMGGIPRLQLSSLSQASDPIQATFRRLTEGGVSTADVAPKDQAASSKAKQQPDSKPRSSSSGGSGIKFTYSVQGKQGGTQWVAKMPLADGRESAPMAYLSSGSPPVSSGRDAYAFGDDDVSASMFSNMDRGLAVHKR